MMDIADGLAAEVYFAQLAFLASDDCDGSRCQEHALPELYRRHIQQMRQCHTGDHFIAGLWHIRYYGDGNHNNDSPGIGLSDLRQ